MVLEREFFSDLFLTSEGKRIRAVLLFFVESIASDDNSHKQTISV